MDFTYTDRDRDLMEAQRRENEVSRRHARAADVYSRDGSSPFTVLPHPDVADIPDPYGALDFTSDEHSPDILTQAFLRMVGATDADLRNRDAAFGTFVLKEFGTREQKEKYGHLRLAIGLTEPGAGSDPSMIRSHARRDPRTGEYVLNGEKTFISFFNVYDGAVVLVRADPDEQGGNPFATFVITKDQPGVGRVDSIRKMGIRQNDLSGFVMQDVRVPADAKLASDFAKTFSKFNHNRPIVAATALGTCRSLLDFTKEKLGIDPDYSKGNATLSAAEQTLMRLEAMWEAAWGTVTYSKWKQAKVGSSSYAYRTEASIAKALGGKVARIISQECLDILGPEGLSEEYLAEKWFRDVRIADIYEGAGEIQRLLIARDVLGYKKELN